MMVHRIALFNSRFLLALFQLLLLHPLEGVEARTTSRYLRSPKQVVARAACDCDTTTKSTTNNSTTTGGGRSSSNNNNNNNTKASYVLRWAASGGGWRAMTSNMGFANVFGQAGLLGLNSTQFNGISSNSGGSWFSTQLFYSPNFYQTVVATNVTQFVTDWMDAYAQYQSTITTNNPECVVVGQYSSSVHIDADACNILAYYGGSWADFVQAMLLFTSTNVFNDSSFVTSPAEVNNRVSALSSTDLMIQMTLSQASITDNKSLSYISPSGTQVDGNVFAVPLAMQHTVQSNQAYFRYGVPSNQLPLSIQYANAPLVMDMEDWEEYYLYPKTSGNALTTPLDGPSPVLGVASLSPIFNGQIPTVAQIAAASSAAAGGFSGLSPATLVQQLSLLQYIASSETKKLQVSALGEFLYLNDLTDKLAMCDQWPTGDCGPTNGILIDGGYIDNNAVAMNVGEYHTSALNGSTGFNSTIRSLPTLKLIVTVANEPDDASSDALLCSYFRTDFNQNVTPGDFLWPVVPGGNGTTVTYASSNPVMSLQIFQDNMTSETLASLRQPIPGTNLTTAVITATTIANPVYGTVSDQRVDLLYIETHIRIPTIIIGYNSTQYWTPYLVSGVNDIALVGRDTLLQRIHDFLAL